MCALQQAALDCCRPSLLYSPTGGLAPLWVARGGPPSTIPRHCTESFSVLYAVIQSLSIYVWLHALGCCAGTHGARMVHVLLAVSCVSVEPACIWTSRMKTSPVQVSFLAAAYVRGPAENVLYCNVAVPSLYASGSSRRSTPDTVGAGPPGNVESVAAGRYPSLRRHPLGPQAPGDGALVAAVAAV